MKIRDKQTGEVYNVKWDHPTPPSQDDLHAIMEDQRAAKSASQPPPVQAPSAQPATIGPTGLWDTMRNIGHDIGEGEFSSALGRAGEAIPQATRAVAGGVARMDEGIKSALGFGSENPQEKIESSERWGEALPNIPMKFLQNTVGDPSQDEPGGAVGMASDLITDPVKVGRSIFPSGALPGEEQAPPTGQQLEFQKMFEAPTIPEKVGRAITGSVPFVGPMIGSAADQFTTPEYEGQPIESQIANGLGASAGVLADPIALSLGMRAGGHLGESPGKFNLLDRYLENSRDPIGPVDPIGPTGTSAGHAPLKQLGDEASSAFHPYDEDAAVADFQKKLDESGVKPQALAPEPTDSYERALRGMPPMDAPARLPKVPDIVDAEILRPTGTEGMVPVEPPKFQLSPPTQPNFSQSLQQSLSASNPQVGAVPPVPAGPTGISPVGPVGGPPPGLPPVGPPLLPKGKGPRRTSRIEVKGGPNRAERAAFSVRRNIEKIPEVGPKLAKMFGDFENSWRSEASNAIALRRELTDTMTKAQKSNLVDVLDGNGRAMDQDVGQAAAILRLKMDELAKHADAGDVLVNYKQDYFPHKFADDTWDFDAPKPLSSQDFGDRPNPNLEKSRRSGRTDYRKDVEVLDEYFHDAYRRVSEAHHLGKHLQKALDSHIALQPEIKQYVETAAKRLTGREKSTVVTRFGDKARHIQALSDLGLSAPLQAGQLPFTAAEGGVRRSMRAAVALAKNYRGEMLKAIKSGALWPNISHEVSAAAGGKRGFLWGVPTMDRMMRVHANTVGRLLVEDAMGGNKAAVKQLKKMGFQPPPSSGLTTGAGVQALSKYVDKVGQHFTDKTNFRTGVLDMPLWTSSPVGKMAAQYSQFSYRATKAVTDIMKDTTKGNVKPLAKLLATGIITGEVISDVRSMVRGDDTKLLEFLQGGSEYSEEEWKDALRNRRLSTPEKRLLQNMLAIGVGGMYQKGYEMLTDWRKSKAFLGPVANTAMDAYDATRKSADQETVDPAVEFGLEQLPIWGHKASKYYHDEYSQAE
jgi:hypothetical protein